MLGGQSLTEFKNGPCFQLGEPKRELALWTFSPFNLQF